MSDPVWSAASIEESQMDRRALGLVLGVLLLAMPAGVRAAPGDLDPTFGTGGKVTTTIAPGSTDLGVGSSSSPTGSSWRAEAQHRSGSASRATTRTAASTPRSAPEVWW